MLLQERDRVSSSFCSKVFLRLLFGLELSAEANDSGPPGVGRTLTAEAISEQLERPLYSVCFFLSLE